MPGPPANTSTGGPALVAHRHRTRDVLLAALRRRPRVLAVILAWSLAETAPAALAGLAVARAIDAFLAGRGPAAAGWLGILAAAWLVGGLGTRQVLLAVARIVEPLRDELLERVVGGALTRAAAPGRTVDTAAITRLNYQVELVRDTFAGVVTVVRGFVFTLIGVVAGMASLSPALLVVILPPVAAGLALFLASLPALARAQRELIRGDEVVAETATEVVRGLRDIVACRLEPPMAAGFGATVQAQARSVRRLARLTAVRTACLGIGAGLPVVLLLAGTPWLLRGGATPGLVLGALTYLTQALTPALNGLVQGLGTGGVRLVAALDRILETGADPAPRTTAHPDRGEPVRVVAAPAPVGVELREVRFAFSPHADPVLDGCDLSVPPGDHLAVVGPSGIGKSTLAALVAGLLRPDVGQVLIGGRSVDDTAPGELTLLRTLLPQEAYVFQGTVRENLTYLRPDATSEAVEAAVSRLGLSALVDRLGGYDARIVPAALSAGERQLVALARAYLSAAPLVILDEATCHLDPAAEARAEQAFSTRDGTLIVIAHRISSAVRARRVLVMGGTRVIAGTHQELLGGSALYRELVGHWRSDSEGRSGPVAAPEHEPVGGRRGAGR